VTLAFMAWAGFAVILALLFVTPASSRSVDDGEHMNSTSEMSD
jgi:hypothetical protein